MNYIYKAHFAY